MRRLVVAVMTLTAVAVSPVRAELLLDIGHRARAVHPGEVVVVEVRATGDPVEMTATAFGQPIQFYAGSDGVWSGLVGIDVLTEPGSYSLVVRASAAAGETAEQTYELSVEPKEFPTRRLTVNPNFVNPPPEVIERIQREAAQMADIFETASNERLWSGGFARPVPGESTSSFGRRSVFNGEPRSPHSGTDFRAPRGTPIEAPNRGVVVLAQDLYFSGNCVILDHGWGLYSFFAHLSAIDVAVGDEVEAGMVVGKVGATGRVTGPHLHWTVRLNNARVDPISLMELLPPG